MTLATWNVDYTASLLRAPNLDAATASDILAALYVKEERLLDLTGDAGTYDGQGAGPSGQLHVQWITATQQLWGIHESGTEYELGAADSANTASCVLD